MSIAAMRRFDLLAHASTRDAVLATMQSLGVTHVDDASARLDVEHAEGLRAPPDGTAAEDTLQTVQQCLAFIDRYGPKRGLIEQLKEPRLLVQPDEVAQTVDNFALDNVADRVRELESRLAAARTQITKREVLRADLLHWEHLDCACADVCGTSAMDAMLAVVDTVALDKLQDELREVTPYAHIHVLERGRPSSYLLLLALREVADAIGPVLKKYGLRTVNFGDLEGTPKEARARMATELEALTRETAALVDRAAALATHRPALMILADHYASAVATTTVETQMVHTSASYYLTGWVPEREEARLTAAIHAISPAIALAVEDPAPDDDPPILLENTASTPFEMISGMYGTPRYGSTDPTAWFAPWFAMFFGLCLTDAGYGFILTGLMAWALVAFKLEGGQRALVGVLLFGGICTIIAGTLTGGWFGIAAESLPGPLQSLIVLNPMVDGVQAFRVTLGIGVIHIFLGVSILMVNNLKRGRIVDALCDQGVWLLFIPCMSILLYTSMFGGVIESDAVNAAAKNGAILCTVLVILTGSREGNPAVRLLMGVAKLYDVMGYFGDVLSYSRLFALGLATGAIGAVTNTMAAMAGDLPWGLGFVVVPLVLIVGHTLNIVINALGAFIHSMRLQFIEFFGKFFQDGGRPFRPFADVQTYTALEGA